MQDLRGKVGVVTGGGGGIGKAIGEAFLAEGMKVVLADIVEEPLRQAVKDLGSDDVIGVVTDVTSYESLCKTRDEAIERFGAVHVICNNAGVGSGAKGHMWEHHLNDWKWSLDVNVLGVINGQNAFVPALVAQDEGHVVNTSSGNGGFTPMVSTGIYPVTKAAVTTLTECLWGQLRELGSNVSASILYPSTRTCFRFPQQGPRVTELISNSDGFRSSRELGEPDPRARILVAGDSLTEGLGVEEGERYTEILEARSGWRVDNIGIAGFGVGHMIRALDAFAEKARPDVVVLGIYVDDFRRENPLFAGIGFPIAKFVLDDGRLVDQPFRNVTGLRRSRIIHGIERTWVERDPLFLDVHVALLGRFLELAERDGYVAVVLYLPGRDPSARVDRAVTEFLRTQTAQLGLAYLDLTDVIHAAGPSRYIEGESHFNPHGHRAAGEALRRFLLEGGIAALERRGGNAAAASFTPRPWATPGPERCHDAAREPVSGLAN